MTNTDVCNMALGFIAKTRITSLADNTEESRQCKLFYDHCRKLLLRDYTWGFAKKIVQLSRVDKNIAGWQYAYAYPAGCLYARFIFNSHGAKTRDIDRDQYDIFKTADNIQVICCDIENAMLEYIDDVVDVSSFSIDFVEALARLLASNIAKALTGDMGIQQTQYQLYQIAIQRAHVNSANERQKDVYFPNDYVKARM